MKTLGEALATQLIARGVEIVFGIPGVHTIELYRGLGTSALRHVTARHEQGAGFMADGYARVSGKPGVALVITGPGLTNILTPMAQARADSVPMLVISGVNALASLGRGLGHLHELPDQQALAASVALTSQQVTGVRDLIPALDRAFAHFHHGRCGPAHVEIPVDVAGQGLTDRMLADMASPAAPVMQALADPVRIEQAARLLEGAVRPVIVAGGGVRHAGALICEMAERLGAPVVQTINARGVMFGHELSVPASPSLQSVRKLIGESDLVLALGTEFGPTDYDMYATGTMARMACVIRIDTSQAQLDRHRADMALCGDGQATLRALYTAMTPAPSPNGDGAARAARARAAAREEIGARYRSHVGILEAVRDAVPGALMVGDSLQPIYGANLYYDHDRPGGWFNAATGYGALGYGIPAAIGAALAAPAAPVICITGDGGAQFSLAEIMTAVDEALPVIFVIWNNRGYYEIAASMQDAGVSVVGCDPTPPDFAATAASFGIPFRRCNADGDAVGRVVKHMIAQGGPAMIEIEAPQFQPRG